MERPRHDQAGMAVRQDARRRFRHAGSRAQEEDPPSRRGGAGAKGLHQLDAGDTGQAATPDLLGPLGNGVRGQAIVGAVVAGVAAYFSVRFLVRFFETRTLTPFAIYCFVVGGLSIIRFH